jgi:hypothetical protein
VSEEKRAEAFFLCERRRSRRPPKRDPRGRDVRAADLQEKPTKRARVETICGTVV